MIKNSPEKEENNPKQKKEKTENSSNKTQYPWKKARWKGKTFFLKTRQCFKADNRTCQEKAEIKMKQLVHFNLSSFRSLVSVLYKENFWLYKYHSSKVSLYYCFLQFRLLFQHKVNSQVTERFTIRQPIMCELFHLLKFFIFHFSHPLRIFKFHQ